MNGLRHMLRWLRAVMLAASGAIWLAKRRLRKNNAIVVLAFHRVLDDPEVQSTQSLSGMLMRRHTFEKLVAHVARRCEVADLSRTAPGTDSPRLRIAFTFDDGWRDNYAAAYPIAQKFNIPITIFICPGLIGLDSPFWPEQVAASIRAVRPMAPEEEIEAEIEGIKLCSPEGRQFAMAALPGTASRQLHASSPDKTLSWEQIAEMDRGGVAFGAHTQTHQILTVVPENMARLEILESKATVERELDKSCDLFAYPNGNHSHATRLLLKEAGFSLAFTTRTGAWTTASDPLTVPRVNMSESDVAGPTGRFSPAMFEYSAVWQAARPLRTSSH
jgi:peptidoglycan/xylan/chitin deacetylase (PgdA/CDA1 family)